MAATAHREKLCHYKWIKKQIGLAESWEKHWTEAGNILPCITMRLALACAGSHYTGRKKSSDFEQ